MALVERRKYTADIPHEPGCKMIYRALKGKELRRAERVAQERSFEIAGKAAAASPGMAALAQEERKKKALLDETKLPGQKPKGDDKPPSPDDYAIDVVVAAGVLGITGPGYDAEPVKVDEEGDQSPEVAAFDAKTDCENLDEPTELVAFDLIMGASKVPSL